jgi:hypothetical protein
MRARLFTAGIAGLALLAGISAAGKPRQEAAPAELAPLLEKAAEYCRKLESSVLDYVCREEITEKINPILDAPPMIAVRTGAGADSWSGSSQIRTISSAPSKVKRSYVYDYQCVRKDGRFQEVRTLLLENGKKKNEPNAALKTSVILYEHVMLGPAGIFRKSYQSDYDFRIIGSAMFDKKPVVIVDAKPKPDAAHTDAFYGQAWIDPVSGNIVKIEYTEKRIDHYEVLEARGKKYGRTPRILLRAEFSKEKNGLRFPSRFSVEETYLNAGGRVFVRSEMTVVYKDFRFFTVETLDIDVR